MNTPDPNLVVEALRKISEWANSPDGFVKADFADDALPHAEAIAEMLSEPLYSEARVESLKNQYQELIAAARDVSGFAPSNPRFDRLRAALKRVDPPPAASPYP